jgi:hypothetical protein
VYSVIDPFAPADAAATPFVKESGVGAPNITGGPFLCVTVGAVAGFVDVEAPENVMLTFPLGAPYDATVFPYASWAVIVRSLVVPAICVVAPVRTNWVAAAPPATATDKAPLVVTTPSLTLMVAVSAL